MIWESCSPTCRPLLHAAPNFLRELVHSHDASGHRRLDFLDRLLDVVGRHGGSIGEAADLGGHHREAATGLARLLGFDRRVEREKIRLVGHLGDGE